MQFIGKLNQNKRGVGSIIGATFLVFILLSGFTFYILTVNINDGYTDVLQTMDQLDLQKKQENVEFVSISTTNEDKLNVTVKNAGSHQTHLIWLGIFDETVTPNTQEYHRMDVYINPVETLSNLPEENITIFEGQERVIQLVTELGNTFNSNYPPREEEGAAQATITITGNNCTTAHNPSQWNLLGSTEHASGSISDLANDDASYVVFRSYQTASSSQSLYAHSETTIINLSPYYLQKLTSADGNATSLSASMGTVGRQLFGKFVYPLTGVRSIPASTWTVYYRAWRDASTQVNPTNNPSSTSGGWTNPTNAYADGGGYAYSTVSANSQVYGGYGFSIPSGAQIIQVRVRLDAWSDGNDDTRLEVSTNGGSSWLATSQTIDVARSETTYWVDVTSWTSWTPTAINSNNIRARVTHVRVGGADNTQYLDYIPIEVTYTIAPAGHCDVDILIRRSGGSVRATIATNIATSGNLTSTAATLSGAYSWAEYVVVDQTDYLEIDYYVDVTTAAAGTNAYLRIDDATLAISNQTRITNIMLPSEYTAEVEFTGSSNLQTWTQLVWQIDSAWNVGQVTVTIQFFNFTSRDFAPSGNGYTSYISSATPNIDELKLQSVDLNPNDFKNSSTGYWRVKIKGVKAPSTQFLFKVDWVNFETTYSTTGSNVPYNVWQWYTIRATTASGSPIPYGYVSIYANRTSVAFRNATDKASIANPAWVRLDARGEFQLEIKSNSGSPETFVLYAVVGSVVGKKTITQEAP